MQDNALGQAAIALSDTAGPASYGGSASLVALNLGFSTALTLIAALFCADLIKRLWVNRHSDRHDHPVTVFRVVMLLVGGGIFIRKGVAAAVLWKWNPADPAGTHAFLTVQRFLDPVADVLHLLAIGLAIATARTMIDQLRKVPWLLPIRQSFAELRIPATLAALSFIAAYGVVLTR